MQHTSNPKSLANQDPRRLFAALVVAMFSSMFAPFALAADLSGWTSSAHLGYAVNQGSTTGFDRVAGSLVFLDVGKPILPELEVGMRTTLQGGEKKSHEYYRMGVGPLISWNISPNWRAQAALSFFNESATNDARQKAYRSQGQALQLGWQRLKEITDHFEIAWGGFYIVHRGDIKPEAHTNTAALAPGGNTSKSNQGATRGVEFALKFRL